MSFARESASRIGKDPTPFDTGHHMGLRTTENEFLKSSYSTEDLIRMKHLFRKKSHIPNRDPIRQHNDLPPKSTNHNRCEGSSSSNTVFFDSEFKSTKKNIKIGWGENSEMLKRTSKLAADKDLTLNEMSQKYFSKRNYNDGSGGIFRRQAGGIYMKPPHELVTTGRASSRNSAGKKRKDKKEVTQFLSTFSPTCHQYQRMAGGDMTSELLAQKKLKQSGILGKKKSSKPFNLSQSMKDLHIDPTRIGMERLGVNFKVNLGDGSSKFAEQEEQPGEGSNELFGKTTKELLHSNGGASVARMAGGWGGTVGAENDPHSSRSNNQLSSRSNKQSSRSMQSKGAKTNRSKANNQKSDNNKKHRRPQSKMRVTSRKAEDIARM